MTLWDCPVQCLATITHTGGNLEEPIQRRLREIGIEKGQKVRLIKRAPWKGPIVLRVADGIFSLEYSLAREISISIQDESK
jgi:Fe2+ transport system protein FeoA